MYRLLFIAALLLCGAAAHADGWDVWKEKAAAFLGDAEAQYSLGLRYADGEGVPEDDAEAIKWIRKAAMQEHANAQTKLGRMYATGEGVPEDDAEAVEWYRKAAMQGHADAQNKLG